MKVAASPSKFPPGSQFVSCSGQLKSKPAFLLARSCGGAGYEEERVAKIDSQAFPLLYYHYFSFLACPSITLSLSKLFSFSHLQISPFSPYHWPAIAAKPGCAERHTISCELYRQKHHTSSKRINITIRYVVPCIYITCKSMNHFRELYGTVNALSEPKI